MGNRVRAVVGCPGCGDGGCKPGQDVSCGRYVVRGDGVELGRIVDSVVVGDGEVWEIAWPDGTIDLLSTTQLAGVRTYRPPNRPPKDETAQ
ncbi:hypothetical protein GCM10011577_38810 [Pseudarthrobacter polychromogenes]|uniref:DUF4314 domain-containing protein n=1 Tax=Pseudarthrobacter polychromogenes TaxID=1676 RepID=A0ABQ1Y220_9MICC|nr:hypothetical protein GCM10011577_38810 [Pseudarthrobacter polychromogenes]